MQNKETKPGEMYRYSKLMNSNKRWWLFGIIPLIFSMCNVDNHKLLLINNTNKRYFYRLLADTTDLKKGLYIYPISAHDSVHPLFVRGGDGAWEYQINKYSLDSSLNIYLFDNSEITEKVISLHKYKKTSYKIRDLDQLKWKITIP